MSIPMKMVKTIPAIPVRKVDRAVSFYEKRLGFTGRHVEENFAILKRDGAEIHLWEAYDNSWMFRSILLFVRPVWSGAETFLAGTASCRIEVESIDDLFVEYREQGVLYKPSTTIEQTSWGTREFPVLDLHQNLFTFFEQL